VSNKEVSIMPEQMRCDYCGNMAVIERSYPVIMITRSVKEKVSPPLGAKDMGIYREKQVIDEFEKRRFLLCQSCGATSGSYSWEGDNGGYREGLGQIRRDEYEQYCKRWREWALMPGAVIGQGLYAVTVSEINLYKMGDPDYWGPILRRKYDAALARMCQHPRVKIEGTTSQPITYSWHTEETEYHQWGKCKDCGEWVSRHVRRRAWPYFPTREWC
jgi:hypothetical protein